MERIYEGQLAAMCEVSTGPLIGDMAGGEWQHLDAFTDDLTAREVRPKLLMPFWHVAGNALGESPALLAAAVAMTCAEAVEDVIDGNYGRQEVSLT